MNDKSNIIVFIDWYYPGFKAGGPVRSCLNMVSHLKDDYNFFIVTRNTEYTEETPYSGLKFNEWCEGPNKEKIIYLDQAHENVSFYGSLLKEREYSSVMIMGIFSNKYSILPLKAANQINHPNILVSPRGMLAPGALKIKAAKKKLFLSYANLKKNFKNVVFHVTNFNEEKQVKSKIKSFKGIVVADNFPRKIQENDKTNRVKTTGSLKLVNIARIAPEKNTLFAIEVLSLVKKGNVQLDLYGSIYNMDYWSECLKGINNLPEHITINYKGVIPSENISTVLCDYDFLFLPTLGENFGHIILESLQCGTPVVISDRTPWNHIQDSNAGFVIDLNDKAKFIEVISNLIPLNNNDWNKLSENAFRIGQMKSDVGDLKIKYKNFLGY